LDATGFDDFDDFADEDGLPAFFSAAAALVAAFFGELDRAGPFFAGAFVAGAFLAVAICGVPPSTQLRLRC
jgi:hypothetical protein